LYKTLRLLIASIHSTNLISKSQTKTGATVSVIQSFHLQSFHQHHSFSITEQVIDKFSTISIRFHPRVVFPCFGTGQSEQIDGRTWRTVAVLCHVSRHTQLRHCFIQSLLNTTWRKVIISILSNILTIGH